MFVVRPAISKDIDVICKLAELAGAGFTSLAVGRKALEKRLAKSVKSFVGPDDISPDHLYLLIVEDSANNEVVGMSAVKAQIGVRDPFFNFRILNVAQKSDVTGSRFDMQVLVLVNEYAGASEVGSLFVKDGYRGTGAGRLISQARYMLMAAVPQRFGETVISELRGQVSDTGASPFWDGLGRKFFRMDFNEADKISAEQDNQFILDLMPNHPIYVELLPDAAREVIGQTHKEGTGAKRYLESEGFRYSGVIDIFDGGPSLSAPLSELRTIRDSRLFEFRSVPSSDDAVIRALISNDNFKDFRCVLTKIYFDGNVVEIDEASVKALGLAKDDKPRLWIKR